MSNKRSETVNKITGNKQWESEMGGGEVRCHKQQTSEVRAKNDNNIANKWSNVFG